MNQARFSFLTALAYETLLNQRFSSLPIEPTEYTSDDITIATFQDYSRITGVSMWDLTSDLDLTDGYVCTGLRPGLKLILYNDAKMEARKNHSLCHEIGHIKAGHNKHGGLEEIEAHFFASQMLVPNALAAEIKRRGYRINIDILISKFGISKEAAEKKMQYLKKFPEIHKNDLDDVILAQFAEFLNSTFPKHISATVYERDLEYEDQRREWAYTRR